MKPLSLLAVVIVCACRTGAPSPAAPAGAEATVFSGGPIWTGDPESPSAEAVAVIGDRIVAVGSHSQIAETLAALKATATKVDLAGRPLFPGFIDAHAHIMGGGLSFDRLDLNPYPTRAGILKAVAEYAKAHPDAPWILGRGWSYDAFKPAMPTRAELDAVVSDRPVYLRSYDGHTGWANSAAMRAAGISAATLDPKGGQIARTKGSREPAGTLHEEAMSLVGEKVPPATPAEKRRAVEKALEHATKNGVTALCEVGASLADLDIYDAMDREGALTARVVYGPSIDDGIPAYAARREQLLKRPRRMLTPGPLKGFVDGVIESNTAAMLQPYADGSGAGSAAMLQADDLYRQVKQADALGIDVAYHAIGDAAVRSVLDAVERVTRENPPRDRRHRIEHIEVVAASDLPRFARLGVIASMMPAHAEPGDEPNGGVWSTKVGKERVQRAFAFASLWRAGAKLAFGSDWPVASIDPLDAIAIAVTRQGSNGKPAAGWIPEQRIPLPTAIDGYTRGAAHACRLDDAGALKAGYVADLVVLSKESADSNPSVFFKAKVELTMIGGRIAYRGN